MRWWAWPVKSLLNVGVAAAGFTMAMVRGGGFRTDVVVSCVIFLVESSI